MSAPTKGTAPRPGQGGGAGGHDNGVVVHPDDNNHPAAALALAERGWGVFPLHEPVLDGEGKVVGCSSRKVTDPVKFGKAPRTPHGFKDATTDEKVIRRWWKRWPSANVGVATGAGSGILVLDIDPRNGGDQSLAALIAEHGPLPDTVECRTGGGGRHIYFNHPGGEVGSRAHIKPGIDVKADLGYVLAPPSLHGTGHRYQWKNAPGDMPLRDVPPWLLRLILDEDGTPTLAPADGATETPPSRDGLPARVAQALADDPKLKARWEGDTSGLRDVSRSGVAMSIAERLLFKRVPRAEVHTALQAWGRKMGYDKCDEERWRTVTIDAAETLIADRSGPQPALKLIRDADDAPLDEDGGDDEDGPSQGGGGRKPKPDELIEALTADIELFHTADALPFARVPVGTHLEVHHVRSEVFKRWLGAAYYAKYKGAPKAETLEEVLRTLTARACFEGPEREVHVRLADHEGRYYLDLGDRAWRWSRSRRSDGGCWTARR